MPAPRSLFGIDAVAPHPLLAAAFAAGAATAAAAAVARAATVAVAVARAAAVAVSIARAAAVAVVTLSNGNPLHYFLYIFLEKYLR